jgi:choline dehydrogenase-like flavoprotein
MSDDRRVIVIGSGPSGATAALKLVQQGIPVTMLESGRGSARGLVVRAFGRNIYRKWPKEYQKEYESVATGDPQTEWHHALAPGGLSNYWTGAVPRFAPEDFVEGARLHERYRWPITYDELAPYYTYAERLLGVVGERRAIAQVPPAEALVHERTLPPAWQTVARQAERLGQGLVYAPLADGPNWMVRRSAVAFNSFERIVSRLVSDPHFELRLGAHVQRLMWNGERGQVDGVEYIDRATNSSHHLDASAVVVAAGPLASPKLLLQSSATGFPGGLGNRNGVLGRYLHDHPKDWCVLELDRPLPRLDQPLHLSRIAYAQSSPLLGASLTVGPLSRWDRLLSLTGATTTRFGLVTFATMRPEEHNYVRLDSGKRDQFGMPVLDIHIRYADEVAQTIAASHQRLHQILKQAGLRASLECPLTRLAPGWAAHFGGAVRMHDSPEHGVLNRWNRMHEVDNVAVVDASSFTTGVEKNPTLTAMALSARAANRLAHDLKSGNVRTSARRAYALSSLR